jgi:hypothetical protein
MLNSFLDLYEILNTILESDTEAIKAEACSILLLDEKPVNWNIYPSSHGECEDSGSVVSNTADLIILKNY